MIRNDRIENIYALFANTTTWTLFAVISKPATGAIWTTSAFAKTRRRAIATIITSFWTIATVWIFAAWTI